jgi:hypothetical protein
MRLKSTLSNPNPRKLDTLKDTRSWNHRSKFFEDDKGAEFSRLPAVTANQLRNRKTKPKRVKMLMRDFIEGLETTHFAVSKLIEPR